MTIIKQSREFTNREMYKLTKDQSLFVKDYLGSVITPAGFVQYEDTNERGENVNVLAIITPEGEVYSTVSDTFKRAFYDICEVMKDEAFNIIIAGGTTKNGRNYVTCTLQ